MLTIVQFFSVSLFFCVEPHKGSGISIVAFPISEVKSVLLISLKVLKFLTAGWRCGCLNEGLATCLLKSPGRVAVYYTRYRLHNAEIRYQFLV